MELFSGYCIDTNALIDLWRRKYPKDIFESLWKKIEGLIGQGLLIAPISVLEEIKVKDDELCVWAKEHDSMFLDLDTEQWKISKQIAKSHPSLIDTQKQTEDADPYVIALAKVKDFKVVTSENKSGPGARLNIPNVCDDYKVEHLNILEFMRENGWKF